MAKHDHDQDNDEPLHRGRIQAQGGGTEKSEAWSQGKPPTEREMLGKCDQLEAKLTDREKADRQEPLARLRRFIREAAKGGGVKAPTSKSFLKRGSKNIRIDIEVIKGLACVPDSEDG
ncbi:MAG TPA: hypothetical protein VFA26_13775 [Gemmataceae bacterium]|nr:hypothetical protein [Gemmataceae bacterium]